MKVKVTRKSIANAYFCKTVGYCDLQYLFYCYEPTFYTCGVYGWNFDAYTHENKCVCTGYRGMIGERIPSEIVRKYNDKAMHIWSYEDKRPYEEKRKAVDELIEKFWDEAFN